jgi:cysteine desulfurase
MSEGYLDFNATTPMSRAATLAFTQALRQFGNPSAGYRAGHAARSALELARGQVARLLGADREEITFTSGGTEANNWALKGVIDNLRRLHPDEPIHIVVTAIEHASVLETVTYLEDCRGVTASRVRPDADGIIRTKDIVAVLQPETKLVAVMLANNEVGTIQPIRSLAAELRPRGIRLHVDAVQAVGKIPVDVRALAVDTLAFSAHKFHGPKGTGGLYVRSGLGLEPLLHGGGQEGGRRAGTEALAGIVASGVAAEECMFDQPGRCGRLRQQRDALRAALATRLSGVSFHGPSSESSMVLPNTLSFRVAGIRAEALVALLDHMHGFQVSLASACTNNKAASLSHVLLAMGLAEVDIRSALRVSLGDSTSPVDIARFVDAMVASVAQLRSISIREDEDVEDAA